MKTIKIGTRGSLLALTQANTIAKELSLKNPEIQTEIITIKSTGDIVTDRPLTEIGGNGLFTSALEAALFRKEIDLAVHSMKDLPTQLGDGLMLAASPLRADPRDVFILKPGYHSLFELPSGSVIGTGSPRRILQLKLLRNDLNYVPIRGNIDSRIAKVGKEVDGVILAAAGISRLGISDRITGYFAPQELLPAACQGILGLEIRKESSDLLRIIDSIKDENTVFASLAEQAFLYHSGAGCHMPVAAYTEIEEDTLKLTAIYGNDTGYVKGTEYGCRTDASSIGKCLAHKLLEEFNAKYKQ